jgi:hypothetical protein
VTLGLTDATTITVSVGAVILGLGLFALLRILLRREEAPASWRRFRVGLFVERDEDRERDKDEP